MKTFTWIVVCIILSVGGFFLGRYYEANRKLELEDITDFHERIEEQAGDWKDSFKESLKDKLDNLLE